MNQMYNDSRTQQYRDNQLANHLIDIIDESPIFYKCAGCCEKFEESEVKPFKMHDLNGNKELNYCFECIEYYKSENL